MCFEGCQARIKHFKAMLTVSLRNIYGKCNLRARCCEVKWKNSEYENIVKIGPIGATIERNNQFMAKGSRFGKIRNYLGSFIFDFAWNGVK